ncbi:MAG: flagellar export chaperone FlgN [Planctomycetota bacterium]|jgi:hypothetical protein
MKTVKRMDWGELARLFEEQVENYKLLLSLSKGQRPAFEKGGARAVMKIVARKQEVINRLEALDKSLLPYTKRWHELLPLLPAPGRSLLEGYIDEMATLIRRVMASEREMEDVIAKAARVLAGRCRKVSSGLKAARAYGGGAVAPVGRLVDGQS